MLLGMQGLGKPGVHQAKMIEWNLWTQKAPLPYQGTVKPQLASFAEQVRPPGSFDRARMRPVYLGTDPRFWN